MTTRLLLLILMFLFLTHAGRAQPAGGSVERRFLWNQANAQMSTAQTVEDFRNAAQTYERLVDAGVRNGPVFYNLGTAYLKGKQYAAAVRALRRAERFTGNNPEITRNLLIALARDDRKASLSMPWYRFPLFWHYGLSADLRITIAAGAFSACCILFAFWRLGSTTARQLLFLALIVLLLFGSSAATTLYQEAQDRRVTQHPRPPEMEPTT